MSSYTNIVWSKQTLAAARSKDGQNISISWHGVGLDPNVIYGEGLMPPDWGDNIYKASAYLADNWHRQDERSFLMREGLDFGVVPKVDLFQYFLEHLRIFQAARKIYEENKGPFRIFDDGSRFYFSISRSFESFGVQIEEYPAGSEGKLFAGDWVKRRFHYPLAYIYYHRQYRKEEAEAGFRPGDTARIPNPVLYMGQLSGGEMACLQRLAQVAGLPAYFAGQRPQGYRVMCRNRLPGKGIYDWLPPKREWRSLSYALFADYRMMEDAGGPFVGEYFNPVYSAFIRSDITYRPQTYLVHLPLLYAALRKMLDDVKPRAIVHCSDVHPVGYITAQLARDRGIPTINIQNGITGGITYGFLPLLSDMTCCWGEHSRDWMTAGGADATKTTVTGSPQVALLRENVATAGSAGADTRGRFPGEKVILVATNDFDRVQNRYLILAALAEARRHPDWSFIFRPHPSETQEVQEGLLEAAGLSNTYIDRSELTELAPFIDAAIIGHSGIGVDLVIAGIPIVYVNFMTVADYIPYAETGAALAARRPEDVGPLLDKALHTGKDTLAPGREMFRRLYLGEGLRPFDEIAGIINRLVDKG